MFDPLYSTYKKIISSVGIVGYLEEDIIKRGSNTKKNLQLNCLYAYPNKETCGLNPFIYQMMFPDDNHKIPCPKFFTLTLTNQQAIHSYLYCLKFSEKYTLTENEENKIIDVPIVIFIKSEKQDLESFKQLLNTINYIIVNDDLEKEGNTNYKIINNYKKVQLINFFYFLFSLPHASPHTLIKLKIDKEIINNNIESIDFYFSSNCEIPCNKNDTDINLLFLLLEQSIIIKALFAILTEKQIVFMASQAYILHIIIPSILKLIFPFKWTHSCITVLPKEEIRFLDAIGAFIFGVLSDVISLKDLMREYPGKIIVDCDTNEIFGDSYLEAYEPPNNRLMSFLNRENKKKDSDILNLSDRLTQGSNMIDIWGSYLYKYEIDPKIKKTKIRFEENNNIIIDTKKSQLLIDKSNAFVNSDDWKWLRKNIQLVRNPEIFDLDNISNKKNGIYLSDEDDGNIILQNRPFSYNIQNIFMIYILNKLEYSESDFMSLFRQTNLFLSYNEKNKYQNNSGRAIVENILDLKRKKQQRNIENSFIIEYIFQSFKTQNILDKLSTKLEKKSKINEENEKNYKFLKLILNDYKQLKNEEETNNFESMYNKESMTVRRSDLKVLFGKSMKSLIPSRNKNKASLLWQTNSINFNFILSSAERSAKKGFKFYKEDGFLRFINIFEKFLNEEKLDIKEELYEQKINEQILDIIINNEDIFNQNVKYGEGKILNNNKALKTDSLNKKEINKSQIIPIIKGKSYEEEAQKININNKSLIRGKNNINHKSGRDDYIGSALLLLPEGGINYSMNSGFDDLYSDRELNKFLYFENIINFFPNYSEIYENSITENKDEINHKCQFYLFIASILENISENKVKADELIDKIKKKKKMSKIDIKSLILRLYIIAFKFSGEKHRDFPYFSYYKFLKNMELEKLKILNKEFSFFLNKEKELSEIFTKVINDFEAIKNKNLQKKLRKEKMEKEKTEIQKIQKVKIEKEKKLKELIELKEKEIEIEESDKKSRKKSKSKMLFKFFDMKTEKNLEHRPNFLISNSDFNLFLSYPINTGQEFETKNENLGYNFIIKSLAEEILSILPNKTEIMNKSNQDIISETNQKLLKNKNIFNYIGQLKYIEPDKLFCCKERICFWVNCFNFLIIFTIFYKKWYIIGKDDWKYFFKKVKYLIGDKYYTFNDIQYLLFKRTLFFQSSYKINEEIKKYRVDKTDDAKNLEKKYPLLYNPFAIYLPTKCFLKPIILETNKLEEQLNERIKKYLGKYIIVDKQKNITLPELLINYQPRFIYKEYKKFHDYLDEKIFDIFKEKKYKHNNINYFEWILDFDELLNY